MQGSQLFIIPFRLWLPQTLSHYLIRGSRDIFGTLKIKRKFCTVQREAFWGCGMCLLWADFSSCRSQWELCHQDQNLCKKVLCINRSDPAKGIIPASCRNSCIKVFIATSLRSFPSPQAFDQHRCIQLTLSTPSTELLLLCSTSTIKYTILYNTSTTWAKSAAPVIVHFFPIIIIAVLFCQLSSAGQDSQCFTSISSTVLSNICH